MRTKAFTIILLCVTIPLIIVLSYGFVERNFLRPKVNSTIEQSDMLVKSGEVIQIDVLNACGVTDVAKKFADFLRERKFDVPETGNLPQIEKYSKILDRVGDPISARKVAYSLGIDPKRIEINIDSTLYLRATVVIGQDFMRLRPMKEGK
ncbi:MAG: LytR C-terminal domain-containing protein [Chlorobiota bacterium]|jgi:hypothetical protein|nr:LytR C-terminal domain-containing protein [Chlorobiota bacterium]QQS66323.1 MAG: LytR C-terminal domain-containing protein [Chlorobiota bacterium]